MTFALAVNYGSRAEIVRATKTIAQRVADGSLNPDDIDEQTLSSSLYTQGLPDPELLVRTSGELRLSNYLLWQIAYSELYFTPTLWPDFGKEAYADALIAYQQRERRFGKTSEQVQEDNKIIK
jgi:undecaprenyl diphosphate synthase